MEDSFELPLLYNGEEIIFPVKLLNYGYSYKLEATVGGTKIIFEPDEERNWRAVISYEDLQLHKKNVPVGLLTAIAAALDNALK